MENVYDDYTLEELSIARESLQDQHRDVLEKAESIASRLQKLDDEYDRRIRLYGFNFKHSNLYRRK